MSRMVTCFFMVAAIALPQQSGAVVNADRTVTFTLKAPQAQKVVLNADFPSGLRNIEMQRNESGEWSVITGPLPRGSHYFRFVVDGIPVLLSSPGPYIASTASMDVVHIRGDEPLPYEIADARMPQGAITLKTFYSEVLGRSAKYAVYTPASYLTSGKLYPVVYLLHGNAGVDPALEDGKQRFPINALMWLDLGFANRIADRLIFDNAAPEVLLVSLDSQGPRAQAPVTSEAELASLITFERYLIDEVVPRVESEFRVQPGQPYRSVAGYSRGAIQALHVSLRRPDLFSNIGVFSGGPPIPFPDSYPVLRDPALLNSQIRLFLAVGRDDTIAPFAAAEALHIALKQLGIVHKFQTSDGEHSLQNWRLYLADFLRTLR